MSSVAWHGIIIAGWPVLSVLLIMSVLSIAIMIDKWKVFSKIPTSSDAFLESLRKTGDRNRVLQWCEKSDQPLAYLAKTILRSGETREEKERSLHRAIQVLVLRLETKINVLGTVASVAPFVGLLGTVIGIIKAFRAVSMSASGGAGVVALGIAEALVGTAGGLVVAIPALLGYNYFVNRLRVHVQDWEIAGAEVVDFALARR